jgi:hypothetical protein
VFRTALARYLPLTEYQVRQTSTGACIDVVSADHAPIDGTVLSKELAGTLERAGIPDPVIEVRTVTQLERQDGTGKLKRFVPIR